MTDAAAAGERRALRVLLALVVLAAALRLWRIGNQSYWLDEVFTAGLVNEDVGGLFSGVAETESTPHLYYLLAWLWEKVAGDGEGALRALSALFGVATVPVAYLAARELFRPAAALTAAALVAVNPWFVWYSQEARAYALLTLVATGSLLFFLRALRTREPRDLALWALLSALAVLTHYFAAFMVGAEALWLLWTLRGRAAAACGGLAAAGIAVAPLALAQRGKGHTTFIEDIPLKTRVGDLPKRFVTGELGTPTPGIGPLAGLLVVAGLALLIARAAPEERRRGLGLAALVAAAVGVPVVLAAAGFDYLLPRNAIAAYVAAAIVLGAGFATSRLGLAAGAALCALMLTVTIQISLNESLQRDDWRAAAAELGEPVPGGRVVVITSAAQAKALEHYLPRLGPYPPEPGDAELPPSGRQTGPGLTPPPERGIPVAEVVAIDDARDAGSHEPGPAPPGFALVEDVREPSFRLVRYRAPSPAPVAPADAARAKIGDDEPALRLQPRR